MDYLNSVIEQAAEKLGGKSELAKHLGIARTSLSDVLANKRGLTPIAQDKLEKLMNLEPGSLRTASEYITAKKPEERDYWKKKLMEFEKIAAVVLLGVILNMSPSPAEASQTPLSPSLQCILCQIAQDVSEGLRYTFPGLPKPVFSPAVSRVDHMTAKKPQQLSITVFVA